MKYVPRCLPKKEEIYNTVVLENMSRELSQVYNKPPHLKYGEFDLFLLYSTNVAKSIKEYPPHKECILQITAKL